ncbi:hypothetical protein B0H14DRAFT_3478621 [Mycena olivaceomarginata]|nr:hypothetical protein B0H14DRAFT_2641000 [Mycena olivaceomarginata]KAJ7812726.1 hypothetical protein B0H14DRAFT_3478621 [Mycena olivaceomarginata]
MFQPFENFSQFYPGLILWCDPNSPDMEMTTLPPNAIYDRRARELRPCLVVSVNQAMQTFEAARFCATVPTDTRQWVRVDSPPQLIWKLLAWIWVGTPATVRMVLHNSKAMHPHKDPKYTDLPVAASNLQNYWIHRQNFLNQMFSTASQSNSGTRNMHSPTQYYATPGSTTYPRNLANSIQSTSTRSNTFTQGSNTAASQAMFNPAYPSSGHYGYNPDMNAQAAPHQAFNTLAPQPVVVPPGFTETHPTAPGWWRNPETGWFWNVVHGLVPPASMRGSGAQPKRSP